MLSVLLTSFPFFALVGLGYGAGRWRLLDGAATAGLNAYVFFFALPALLFSKLAATPVADVFEWRFIGAYWLGSLGLFAVAGLLGRWMFDANRGQSTILGLGAIYSNIGFMGIPLLLVAVGDAVAVPLALILTVDLVFFLPFAMFILELDAGGGGNWRRLCQSVIRVTAKNPVIWGIMGGILVSLAGITPPAPVARVFELLAGTAGPCALFALGAALVQRRLSDGLGAASYMSLCKLVIHPAVIWGAMTLFGVGGEWTMIAVLGISMPMAAVLYVTAQQYDVYVGPASAGVLVSTALSVLSVSAWLAVILGG